MQHSPELEEGRRFAGLWPFILLSSCLLVLTMIWHVPMMLWDHLDLAPIYKAWIDGELAHSAFWNIHGGHFHTAAYAFLLVTTWLSGGHPWMDCLVSWLLLLGYAGIVMLFARETLPPYVRERRVYFLFIVFLALYPGHLANLQWGWQIAVFLCLLGTAVTLFALTRSSLSWRHLGLALAGSTLAFLSFATSVALIPTAIVLVILRVDCSASKRALFALPWLLALIAIAVLYPRVPGPKAPLDLIALVTYALNFLGAGICRFASGLSAPVAIIGLASALWGFARVWKQRDALPWFGLVLFAVLASVLAAIGRAGTYGSEQAFVTRYVSFSSMFWLGWAGLMACVWQKFPRVPAGARAGMALIALLALANGLHMTKKAYEVGQKSRAVAQTIAATYPQIDQTLLADIYYGQPDVALTDLEVLRGLGFPPFEEASKHEIHSMRPAH